MTIAATVYSNNHQIIVEYSNWSGKIWIKYDGQKVSEKHGLTFLGSHQFQAIEDGNVVQYEVKVGFGWTKLKISVIKNGVTIFSDEEGFIPPPTPQVSAVRNPEILQKEVIVKEIVLVICPNCNHRNDSSLRKCENCGASI